jgi:hypothetical protein
MTMKFTMRLLTFLGIIPFLVSTMGVLDVFKIYDVLLFSQGINWAHILVTYAAIILSFLAGIYWGIAFFNKVNRLQIYLLLVSNLVSLSAWFILLIQNPLLCFILFSVFYTLVCIFDQVFVKMQILPRWFGVLRIQITIIVLFCLLISSYALR